MLTPPECMFGEIPWYLRDNRNITLVPTGRSRPQEPLYACCAGFIFCRCLLYDIFSFLSISFFQEYFDEKPTLLD